MSGFEFDFDHQTPHSNSGQKRDSAVRRRLVFEYNLSLNMNSNFLSQNDDSSRQVVGELFN